MWFRLCFWSATAEKLTSQLKEASPRITCQGLVFSYSHAGFLYCPSLVLREIMSMSASSKGTVTAPRLPAWVLIPWSLDMMPGLQSITSSNRPMARSADLLSTSRSTSRMSSWSCARSSCCRLPQTQISFLFFPCSFSVRSCLLESSRLLK